MAQGNALRVDSVSRGPVCYIRLFGMVDESFDKNLILNEAKGSKVILNLRQLTRLSSFGVREWTGAMRELGKKVERVFFVECSPAVVTQLNMVANFSGTAQILSVQAPFFCDSCGWDAEVTCNLAGQEQVQLPELKCQKCGTTMTFDDDPDTYFAFPTHASAQEQSVDPGIQSFLRAFAGAAPEDASGKADGEATVVGTPSPESKTSVGPLPKTARPTPTASAGGFFESQTWVLARSVLAGLAISGALAGVVLLLWPSSGSGQGLPDEDRGQYQTALAAGRFGDASQIVERLERSSVLPSEQAEKLRAEILEGALVPYKDHLEKGRLDIAATLVTELRRDKVLPPDRGARMHEEIIRKANDQYQVLLEAEKFDEGEQVQGQLAPAGVLPSDLRNKYNQDVSKIRDRVTSKHKRAASESFKAKQYQQAVLQAEKARALQPLDADTLFVLAESERNLGKDGAASESYGSFIEMVQNEETPHAGLVAAYYWRGSQLARDGKQDEAVDLFRRVLDLKDGQFAGEAQKALDRLK